jgi:hypothetical protein
LKVHYSYSKLETNGWAFKLQNEKKGLQFKGWASNETKTHNKKKDGLQTLIN